MIWNLNQSKKISYPNFIEKYKNKSFFIQYKKIQLPVQLKKYTVSNEDFYSLSTKDEISLQIDFRDDLFFPAKKVPHTIYLAQIGKNDQYSGSTFVKIAIAIAKHIQNVKYMYLIDAATIYCNDVQSKFNYFDLSLYKLLVSNYTFYGKYGFQYYDRFLKNKSTEISKCVQKIQKIKVESILQSIQNFYKLLLQNYYNPHFYIKNTYSKEYVEVKHSYIMTEFNKLLSILLLLKPYKKMQLKDAILKMHDFEKNGCNFFFIQFLESIKNLYITEFIVSLQKKKEKVKFPWISELKKLMKYRQGLHEDRYFIKKI
jgi:hypothetical protein